MPRHGIRTDAVGVECPKAARAGSEHLRVTFWKAAKTVRALRKAGKNYVGGWCEAVSAAHSIPIY